MITQANLDLAALKFRFTIGKQIDGSTAFEAPSCRARPGGRSDANEIPLDDPHCLLAGMQKGIAYHLPKLTNT